MEPEPTRIKYGKDEDVFYLEKTRVLTAHKILRFRLIHEGSAIIISEEEGEFFGTIVDLIEHVRTNIDLCPAPQEEYKMWFLKDRSNPLSCLIIYKAVDGKFYCAIPNTKKQTRTQAKEINKHVVDELINSREELTK